MLVFLVISQLLKSFLDIWVVHSLCFGPRLLESGVRSGTHGVSRTFPTPHDLQFVMLVVLVRFVKQCSLI